MKLLDSGLNWSAKREEFRGAVLRRMAKTPMIYSPDLRKEAAANIARGSAQHQGGVHAPGAVT